MRNRLLAMMAIAAITVLGFSILITGTFQQAQAATFTPTENVKAWSVSEDYSLSVPSFYIQPSLSTAPGYIKMSVTATNNSDGPIKGWIFFYVDGMAYDVIPYELGANSQKVVNTEKQYNYFGLGLMNILVEMSKLDSVTDEVSALAQRGEIIRITEKWEIVSMPPKVQIDIPIQKQSFKMGNEIGKANWDAGLIENYAEYFEGSSIAYNIKGLQINYIEIPINKVGNPTGQAYIGIFTSDVDGKKPVMKKLFGSIDVAEIPQGAFYYKIFASDFYAMEEFTHVGILYETPNAAGNYLQVYGTTSDTYGGESSRTRYSYGNQRDYYTSVRTMDSSMRIGYDPYLSATCPIEYQGLPDFNGDIYQPWEYLYDINFEPCGWATPFTEPTVQSSPL